VNVVYPFLLPLLLVWPSAANTAAPSSVSEQMETVMPAALAVGCSTPEPWGESIYALDGVRGIGHYVRHNKSAVARFVRFVTTDKNVTHCALTDHALVFVDPVHGIYQIDRAIEADGEQLWIAPTPLHFSPDSFFQWFNDELYLVSGATRDFVQVDTAVRNDHVDGVVATEELSVIKTADRMSGPSWLAPGIVAVSDDQRLYQMRLDSRKLKVLPDLPPETSFAQGYTALKVSSGIRLESAAESDAQKHVMWLPGQSETSGFCLGDTSQIVSFDGSGLVQRYQLDIEAWSVEHVGSFKLSSNVSSCLIDSELDRLYVIERDVGIWVFNLQETGLPMPRAVTTDKMIEGLGGLALYKQNYKPAVAQDFEQGHEQESAGFVLTQSLGDGAFLLFDRADLALLGRFKIEADIAAGIDGVHATRGFVATSEAYPGYPQGLLLVHDQRNRMPETGENLKIVDWRHVMHVVGLISDQKSKAYEE
tara:strand:+ start:14178 stop:15611 length:1434 start_codon:yes stop_codon:yes gene_type:complete